MRVRIGIAMAGLLGGCATTSGDGTLFVSEPTAATVSADGYAPCETPCSLSLAAPTLVTIAKAGYTPQRLQVEPKRRRLSVALDLAAPTEDVEATGLPEL